jgi:hypothetical protein
MKAAGTHYQVGIVHPFQYPLAPLEAKKLTTGYERSDHGPKPLNRAAVERRFAVDDCASVKTMQTVFLDYPRTIRLRIDHAERRIGCGGIRPFSTDKAVHKA